MLAKRGKRLIIIVRPTDLVVVGLYCTFVSILNLITSLQTIFPAPRWIVNAYLPEVLEVRGSNPTPIK